jgi:hypothetical protein
MKDHDNHVRAAFDYWEGNADKEKQPCFSCNFEHFYHAQPWTCAGCCIKDHAAHVQAYLTHTAELDEMSFE